MKSRSHSQTNLRMLLIAVVIFSSLGITRISFAKSKATDSFSKSYPVENISMTTIETTNGAISVSGYDGDEIKVDAEFVVKGKKKEVCEKLVKKIELKIHITKKKFEVETDFKKKLGYSSQVSINMQVPFRMSIEAESMNGGVFVEDITGGVELETVNGGIKCENVSGGVEVETVNGGVSLNNIEGNTSAETVNGGLMAEFNKTTPEQVALNTVNGRVSVSFASTPNGLVEASTINGSLSISGKRIAKTGIFMKTYSNQFGDGKGEYHFSTVNGSVNIDMPETN